MKRDEKIAAGIGMAALAGALLYAWKKGYLKPEPGPYETEGGASSGWGVDPLNVGSAGMPSAGGTAGTIGPAIGAGTRVSPPTTPPPQLTLQTGAARILSFEARQAALGAFAPPSVAAVPVITVAAPVPGSGRVARYRA